MLTARWFYLPLIATFFLSFSASAEPGISDACPDDMALNACLQQPAVKTLIQSEAKRLASQISVEGSYHAEQCFHFTGITLSVWARSGELIPRNKYIKLMMSNAAWAEVYFRSSSNDMSTLLGKYSYHKEIALGIPERFHEKSGSCFKEIADISRDVEGLDD